MASRSLSMPVIGVRKRTQALASRQSPPLQRTAILLVALVILFLWMQFIMALQIESTGRKIQTQTRELQKLERANDALRSQLAEVDSQANLSQRAFAMDYQVQSPVYIMLDEPLAAAQDNQSTSQVNILHLASESQPVLGTIARQLAIPIHPKITP